MFRPVIWGFIFYSFVCLGVGFLPSGIIGRGRFGCRRARAAALLGGIGSIPLAALHHAGMSGGRWVTPEMCGWTFLLLFVPCTVTAVFLQPRQSGDRSTNQVPHQRPTA